MKLDHSTVDRYLDPRLLRALSRLRLTSRRVVEGAMTGSHRSPMKGYSTEFADHREYVKGDDLKHLDWKVLSRTDRYYIKRYEENTNLRAYLLVDCSASMAYPRRPRPGALTKYAYACHVAAGLAYVLIQQQDPVGLVLFNNEVVEHLPPLRSLAHLRRMLEAMHGQQPSADTDAAKALHAVVGLIRRRGLLIVISDLLDEPDRIAHALAHFRQRGHDAIVIHVLDAAELQFPFQKTVTFRDMETDRRITVNGADIAADYGEQLTAFLDEQKRTCFEHHFDYVLASTATPCDTMLTALLSRRQR